MLLMMYVLVLARSSEDRVSLLVVSSLLPEVNASG